MKKIMLVAVLSLCLCWTGCKTTNVSPNYWAIAKVAVWIGTAEYLRGHPEARPAFESVRKGLYTLTATTNITSAAVVAILQELPTNELNSGPASLYISGGVMILWDSLLGDSVRLETPEQVRVGANAVLEGLTLALGPKQ